jgi:3-hydroxyisobutyrate dehydrogenase
MKRVAFIGLGNMGAPMARNLLKAGYELRVFDVVNTVLESFRSLGAAVASSAAEAVRDADAVVTMLPTGGHVKAVYLGEKGILAAARAGTLFIDSSTIAAEDARAVATAAAAKSLQMIDAPVSGGTAGAEAGTLTFIVGAEAKVLESARPLLEKMGKNIFHAGSNGAGQVAKICNNMLLGILMIGTAEALSLGVANGLDPATLSGIMAKSSGRNWALEVYNPWPGVMEGVPASREYSGGFGSELMLKDLGLAQQTAMASRSVSPLGALARELYQLHCQLGQGKLDFSSVLKLLTPTP